MRSVELATRMLFCFPGNFDLAAMQSIPGPIDPDEAERLELLEALCKEMLADGARQTVKTVRRTVVESLLAHLAGCKEVQSGITQRVH